MNKKVIIILVVSAVLIGGFFAFKQASKKPTTQPIATNKKEASIVNLKTACEVYTPEVAKKYLGANAKLGNTANSNSKTDGDNTVISSCLYEDDAEISKIINIQVTAAKTETGRKWNKDSFENSPKQTAEFSGEAAPQIETITSLGDKAYWNPMMGQVNVLIDNGKYWLIVQGSIKDPKSKDESTALAKDIVANF